MKVAILGCGPAGLLAAHAAEAMHIDFDIFSKREPSIISGAQFLHEHIPGLTDPAPPEVVRFLKWGTRAGYAQKVYGDSLAPCSFDLIPAGEHPMWPMRETYDTLLDLYGGTVQDLVVTWDAAGDIANEYPLVISTVPRYALCCKQHFFDSVHVQFTARGIRDMEPNYIVYNGNPAQEWYRASNIRGIEQMEWPYHRAQQRLQPDAKEGMKPLATNCDCLPTIVKVGRFGKWEKGVLVHRAFQEAASALHSL